MEIIINLVFYTHFQPTSEHLCFQIIPENLKKFHWNEREQALALGSFFWTHWITQIPGGILSRRYGTKLVFGLSNVISCWICFLIPYACFLDFNALLVARMLQGLLTVIIIV